MKNYEIKSIDPEYNAFIAKGLKMTPVQPGSVLKADDEMVMVCLKDLHIYRCSVGKAASYNDDIVLEEFEIECNDADVKTLEELNETIALNDLIIDSLDQEFEERISACKKIQSDIDTLKEYFDARDR